MPYRSSSVALESRLAQLEAQLAASEAKLDELRAIEREIAAVRAEMANIAARLGRRRLHVLDGVRVASPCPAIWDDMVGDHRTRVCRGCMRSVYNLSALTRAEAEALIVEHEGKLCVRYFARKDGTVLTADCPVGVRRKWRRRALTAVALAGMAGFGLTAYERAARDQQLLRDEQLQQEVARARERERQHQLELEESDALARQKPGGELPPHVIGKLKVDHFRLR